MFNTIRLKLIVSSLLAIGIPLILFALVLTDQLWDFYLKQLETELRTKGAVIAADAGPVLSPDTPDDPGALTRMVDRWRLYEQIRVTLVDRQGVIRAASTVEDVGDRFDENRRPGLTAALEGRENATIWKNPRYAFEDTMYANTPVEDGGEVVGAVRVAYSLTEIQRGVSRIQYAVLGGFGVYAALMIVLTLLLSGTIAGPLETLKASAQRLAGGELEHRVHVGGTQEVTKLATTLNQMAERLQQFEGMRRQYVSNVSHELRTPLAAIRGMAETLIEHGPSDPELAPQYLPRIVAQTDRLARLATQLLDLAQIESGNILTRREPVSLELVIAEVVAASAPAARARGVRLRSDVPPLPPLQGDRDRLVQVLFNLVENAVRHTGEGGEVTVSASWREGVLEITVADTGEGIPPEHHALLFNRFYRVDPSRSRRSGGSGLGLAIVDEIVRAHGGAVSVESEPGRGTRFIVRFELAEAGTSG